MKTKLNGFLILTSWLIALTSWGQGQTATSENKSKVPVQIGITDNKVGATKEGKVSQSEILRLKQLLEDQKKVLKTQQKELENQQRIIETQKQTIENQQKEFELQLKTHQSQNNKSGNGERKSESQTASQNRFLFETTSKPQELVVFVDEQSTRFDLLVQASIKAGNLNVVIWDPNGDIQGELSVGSTSGQLNQQEAISKYNKSWKDPEPGQWLVKITPSKAVGSLELKSQTLQK